MEDRLRKFVALADAGSFTKAAKVLHLSQPALSTSIAKLEHELRAELIIHGSRPLELTDAGRLAYETAQRLSAQTKDLSEQLKALERKQRNLSVGMIDSVANAMFSSDDSLNVLDGQADVSIVVNNSRFLLEAIGKGELDLALIVTRGRTLPDGFVSYFVANEPLVLVCHTQLASATERALARGKLPRFIAYDKPSLTNRLVAVALRERGIAPQTHFSSTSPEIMLRLVLLQKGVAVLPFLLVRELIADRTLTLLGTNAPIIIERRVSSVVSRAAAQHPTLNSVVQTVRSALNDLDADVRGGN
jgi:DNA-binding transcriptional LysR family regulator